MIIYEPYELTLEQVESLCQRFPLYGGTLCWEAYHAARSTGSTPEEAYTKMLQVKQ